ncbi:MAG: PQQ-binding-like beta-propeller repeat protein [Gemmataceae bacterium]
MPWLRALLIVLLGAGGVTAADWPQWLGPTRDGISTEKVAPWREAPKVPWRQPVGEGHSSPIVADGKVYLHTKVNGEDAEQVIAYDATTGKQLWRTSYPRAAFQNPFGVGPRGTPAVSGKRLYTFGVTGVLTCLNTDNGEIVWQVDTLKEFNAPNLFFGMSGSPLIEKNLVLMNIGGPEASIVAFNKDNGKTVWKKLSDKASYSSPIVLGDGDQRQVVFLTASGLRSLRPRDGELFWEFPLVDKLSESSTTPVRLGELLLASSVTYGSVALRLETKDGRPFASQVWKNPALNCYFSTPVPVGDDQVYIVTGGLIPPPQVTLRCVDPRTGKETWNRPKVGAYHASLLRTGDNKMLMLSDTGELILFDPNAKEYQELARSKVCGKTWAHPALANGLLYLRDDKELICLRMGE